MQFELTNTLMNDILFSMEDQNADFYVDTSEGIVVSGIELDDDEDALNQARQEGRLAAVPEWDSSEGYRLMERFATSFRNPVMREKLCAALDRGKGVFRAFKDVLAEHSEAEQLWFSYKEREMKRVILQWYNALREEWGLERIGAEPEETGDLVLEDFRFRSPLPADKAAMEALHSRCLDEHRLPSQEEHGALSETDTHSALVAETVGGEFAGYIATRQERDSLIIKALEVRPEYRGLGVGEALISRLLASLDRQGIARLLLDLPSDLEGFSRVLLRESFHPYAVRYFREIPESSSKT